MLSRKKASNTRIDLQKITDDPSAGRIAREQTLAQVKAFAKSCFEKASGSHDWDHTLRVFRLCEMMGPAENADMGVLGSAAYLRACVAGCFQRRDLPCRKRWPNGGTDG